MNAYDFDINTLSPGAYVLLGDDIYLRDLVLNAVKGIIPEEHKVFNLKIIENLVDANALKDAISTFSMFDSPIVVIIEDDKFSDNESTSKSYIEALNLIDNNQYVIFSTYKKISNSLRKKLKSIECKIDYINANKMLIKKVVTKMAKDLNISSKAIDIIIEYCSGDLGRIDMELKKLKYYKLNKSIEDDDVDLMVANTMDNAMYELTNEIGRKEYNKAYTMLDRFIEKGIPYAVIRASLTGHYRRMLHASLSNKKDAEIATLFNVKEYSITMARRQAKNYTQLKLMEIVKELVSAEYLHKSGVLDEETAFKNIVTKLLQD